MAGPTPRKIELALRGPAGEPVDLWRTIVSHGIASLPPAQIDEEARVLDITLPLDQGAARGADRKDARALRARPSEMTGRHVESKSAAGTRPPHTVRIREGTSNQAAVEVAARALSKADEARLLDVVRRILSLDEDLSGFYEVAAADPQLSWAAAGAGRMLRSPTVFEDVVKTVCTTNCSWALTEKMTAALVEQLGRAAPRASADGPYGRAFPTPEAMADADERFYRDVVRAGYRGPYFRALAASVAEGSVDLEALLEDRELPDEEVAAQLLALPGVGPYAAAHVMMLIGRYSRLILDSWTRPTFIRLAGMKQAADRTIERRFRHYGPYAGLAFWLYLTKGWVADSPRP